MQLRRNILPKAWEDLFVTSFVIIIIPIVYWFEMFVVLPTFYDTSSLLYYLNFVLSVFLLANISSNFLALIMCDTSIKGRMLLSTLEPNWRFCSACEAIAPPRSWHCKVCKVCILKRDHHCIFVSCCIGHYNLRYFFVFVFYMFVSTLYSSFYNILFIWKFVNLNSFMTIVKLIFPLAMIFLEYSQAQAYVFLCLLILFGSIFTGVLLYYHLDLILHGMVRYEKSHKICMYNLGYKANIVEALGERWYLVWLSPFIASKLPSDGIHWDLKNSLKTK